MSAKILLIDDDVALGQVAAHILTGDGHVLLQVSDVNQALAVVKKRWPHLVVLGGCFGDPRGSRLAAFVRTHCRDLPVVELATRSFRDADIPEATSGRQRTAISELRHRVAATLAEEEWPSAVGAPTSV